MFGTLIYSTIPYSAFDDDPPTPYVKQWVNKCPAEDIWTEQPPNELPTLECDNGN